MNEYIIMDFELTINTDKTKLDINFIQKFLNEESHWASSRSTETIKRSIDNSLASAPIFMISR